MGQVIIIILLGAIVFGGGYAWFRIRRGLRELSRAEFGTEDFIEGFKQQELLNQETPKSVFGVTRLLLPQIEKDFPEFHWLEWKQICENQLKEYLEDLEQKQMSSLQYCAQSLKERIRIEISDRIDRNIIEKFESIKTHQTEIVDYKKDSGLCSIKMQTSVEYIHSLQGDITLNPKKEQHRYFLTLYYIQDITKVQESKSAITVNCNNCGAPITKLGMKFCEYCGSAIEPINLRVWILHNIEQRD